MWRKPGPPVVQAVPALDQQHFLPLHARYPVPALLRAVGQLVNLADTVREDLVGGDQVLRLDAFRACHGQRRALHGAGDRAPDIDLHDSPAGTENAIRFLLAQDVAGADGAGRDRVVDVYPVRRTAQTITVGGTGLRIGAACAIEYHNAIRADRLLQQHLDLPLVDFIDHLVIVKVVHRRLMPAQLESLALQGQAVRHRPHIADGRHVLLALEENLWRATGQRGTVEIRLGGLPHNEGQRRLNVPGRLSRFRCGLVNEGFRKSHGDRFLFGRCLKIGR